MRECFSEDPPAAWAILRRNYVGPVERSRRMPSVLVAQQPATALGAKV